MKEQSRTVLFGHGNTTGTTRCTAQGARRRPTPSSSRWTTRTLASDRGRGQLVGSGLLLNGVYLWLLLWVSSVATLLGDEFWDSAEPDLLFAGTAVELMACSTTKGRGVAPTLSVSVSVLAMMTGQWVDGLGEKWVCSTFRSMDLDHRGKYGDGKGV